MEDEGYTVKIDTKWPEKRVIVASNMNGVNFRIQLKTALHSNLPDFPPKEDIIQIKKMAQKEKDGALIASVSIDGNGDLRNRIEFKRILIFE